MVFAYRRRNPGGLVYADLDADSGVLLGAESSVILGTDSGVLMGMQNKAKNWPKQQLAY